MERDKIILGKNLRNLRINSGYAQAEIADILGLNRSSYTYYETGKAVPQIFDLYRLAKIYNIRMETLLEFEISQEETGKRPKKEMVNIMKEITSLTADERSIISMLRYFGEDYTESFKCIIKIAKDDFERPKD